MRVIITVLIFISLQISFCFADFWEKTGFPVDEKIVSLDNISYPYNNNFAVFAVTSSGDLFISYDNGDSWKRELFGEGKITSVSASYNGMVFAGTEHYGLYRSIDFGKSWEEFNKGIETETANVLWLGPDGKSMKIFIFVVGKGLLKSPVDNCSFISDNEGIEGFVITDLYSRYLGTENGAYYKHNDSTSWKLLHGFTNGSEVTSLVMSPENGMFFTTKGDGVFLQDWSNDSVVTRNKDLTNFNVNTIIGCDDLIIDVFDWWDYDPYIPLYSVLIGTKEGVHFQSSIDDDFHWVSMNKGLKDSNVTCLTMSEAGIVFAGTETDGVYRTTWDYLYDNKDKVISVVEFSETEGIYIKPNPVNSIATILFSMNNSNNVEITLHNSLGQPVCEIFKGFKEAGLHTVLFNPDDYDLSNGIYFCAISANGYTETKKMILLK